MRCTIRFAKLPGFWASPMALLAVLASVGCQGIQEEAGSGFSGLVCPERHMEGRDFPSRAVLDPNYLSRYALDYVIQEVESQPCVGNGPSLVAGDLNGDGNSDIAAIVIGPEQDGKTAEVIFFLAGADDQYDAIPISSFSPRLSEVLIRPVDGMYLANLDLEFSEGIDQDVIDSHPQEFAIEVLYYGKASVVYIWNEVTGSFATIPTSE